MIVSTADLCRVPDPKFAVGAYHAEQSFGSFRGCVDFSALFRIQISKGARNHTDRRMLQNYFLQKRNVEIC